MTRKGAERQTRQADTLRSLGFTTQEAEELRRISMTLQRWFERECGSDSACIVRGRLNDGEFVYDDHGNAYEEYAGVSGGNRYRRIPDRETGARKRLDHIVAARNAGIREEKKGVWTAYSVRAYIQTDPRGAALYIIRPGDVPEGADVQAYYMRGVCVY